MHTSIRTLLVICLTVVAVIFGVTSVFAQGNPHSDSNGRGAVCPAGDVKFEIDPQEYEYTDDSVSIAGNSSTISWAVANGFTVTSVCVKIGGPGGGSTENPSILDQGTAGPYAYGISHVVINTDPTGNQEIDMCPNLPEDQETIPEGYELDANGQCVLVNEDPEPQTPPTGGRSVRNGVDFSNDNVQCNMKEFDVVFDVYNHGSPVNNLLVKFSFNGINKEAQTNVDGRAKVHFPLSSGIVIAQAEGYGSYTQEIKEPVECKDVYLDPDITSRRGQVLGATTLADTGNFSTYLAMIAVLAGGVLSSVAGYAIVKEV